jgi:predicted carbohydrate-binding protein with CBM5 and CBM33 domain
MGRGFGKKKDKFADLSQEYKDAVAGMAEAEVRTRIVEAAMAEEENKTAKEDDQDLKEKQEQAKFAGEQYKLASKVNRLKIQFCRRVLQDSGKM